MDELTDAETLALIVGGGLLLWAIWPVIEATQHTACKLACGVETVECAPCNIAAWLECHL